MRVFSLDDPILDKSNSKEFPKEAKKSKIPNHSSEGTGVVCAAGEMPINYGTEER